MLFNPILVLFFTNFFISPITSVMALHKKTFLGSIVYYFLLTILFAFIAFKENLDLLESAIIILIIIHSVMIFSTKFKVVMHIRYLSLFFLSMLLFLYFFEVEFLWKEPIYAIMIVFFNGCLLNYMYFLKDTRIVALKLVLGQLLILLFFPIYNIKLMYNGFYIGVWLLIIFLVFFNKFFKRNLKKSKYLILPIFLLIHSQLVFYFVTW